MSDEELIYRIAFATIRGMGVDLAQKILDVMPHEKDFFSMSDKDLKEITKSRSKITEKSYRNKCLLKAEHELEFIRKNHISLRYFKDEGFPQRLLQVEDSPIMLYSVGNCDLNAKHIISIVGTRRSTEYGRHFCDTFIKELSEAIPGVVTVSGLAYGTDITAHRYSLKYQVPTVAVQACGLNKIYPASHRDDAAQIIRQNGCIVSDYTSQDDIHKGNFVARNRIIAALSDCTVVVESAERGGSLITANIAQSYNKDVFALPGRISDEYSKGCNRLIQNNQAMLVTSADDLIKAMRWENKKKNKETRELELFPTLSPEEKSIVELIREAGDIHINAIAEKAGLPVYKVMSMLVTLDCKGVILTLPGCRYCMA